MAAQLQQVTGLTLHGLAVAMHAVLIAGICMLALPLTLYVQPQLAQGQLP